MREKEKQSAFDRKVASWNHQTTPREALVQMGDELQECIHNGEAEVSIVKSTKDFVDPLLERNHNNRPISRLRVAMLVRDLQHGNWVFNGAPIVVDADGELKDGQHRLTAIKEAGYPIVDLLLVRLAVSGAASDRVFRTIDTGRARTMANAMNHEGVKHSGIVAAMCRCIYTSIHRPVIPSHSELFALQNYLSDVADTFAALGGKGTFISFQAPVCAALALMAHITEQTSEIVEFAKKVKSGANLKPGTAEYRLFSYLHGRTGMHVSGDSQRQMFCATWRAVRHHLVEGDKRIQSLLSTRDPALLHNILVFAAKSGKKMPCDQSSHLVGYVAEEIPAAEARRIREALKTL